MAIGRPIELTPNITSKNISIAATEGQTEFTVTGGYRINELAVYRNGVRLVDGRDFSATDGNTVIFISDTVVADDIVEFSVFDSFDVAGVIVSASSTQAVNGNLHVTGELYAGDLKPTGLVATAATFNSAFHVGSALTSNSAGDVETIGIITAASFSGDGSALTGIANTATIVSVATTTGLLNVTGTTDSTSSTTGSVTIAGGVGIAKNVYIGAGLSIAGTLTYEDVTNVDAVGLITAKSGVNVTGGQLTVGVAYSVGNAGVVTATGYHGGSAENVWTLGASGTSHYTFTGPGDLSAATDPTLNLVRGQRYRFKNLSGGHPFRIQSTPNGSAGTAYNDGVTNNDGGTGTDILFDVPYDAPAVLYYQCTSHGSMGGAMYIGGSGYEISVGSGVTIGSAGVTTFSGTSDVHLLDSVRLNVGDGSDLAIYHDGNHSYLQNTTGNIKLNAAGFEFGNAAVNENILVASENGSVDIYYDHSKKFATTNEGIEVTGFTSTTAGMGVTGGLFEGSFIKAGKLTDNLQIGIATANVFYFTTAETTTGTPNIRWDDTYSLSSKMAVGDVASVTVITTAAAAGYCANWTIDGNAVTEEWVGGSAPSAGGSDGLDIYSFTIIKIGTGTGDSGFKVIANVSNAT